MCRREYRLVVRPTLRRDAPVVTVDAAEACHMQRREQGCPASLFYMYTKGSQLRAACECLEEVGQLHYGNRPRGYSLEICAGENNTGPDGSRKCLFLCVFANDLSCT